MRIAALDDDPTQLDLVKRSAEAIGHSCNTFLRAEALVHELRRESYDLLVVDWQLPDGTGLEVVRRVRGQLNLRLPILFLTHRGEERDVVEGLAAGADDYMVKPTRVQELMARLRALIRRSYPEQEAPELRYGGFCFHTATRTVSFDGQPIELKQKEYELARCLFAQRGRLLSRAHLMEAVWGRAADVSSRSLDTHVSSLRSKLNLRPERGFRLTAVYGQGYRLEEVDDGLPAGGAPLHASAT